MAILESWEFAAEVAAAVNDQNDLELEHEGDADLSDVLVCGTLMAGLLDQPEQLELAMQGVPAFRLLGLSAANCVELVRESAAEIAALGQAPGN